MFHGVGGNSSEQSGGSAENSYYGWQTSAEQNGFIVLFPEKDNGFNTWDLNKNGKSSDLVFVENLIAWANANYNISESQIFTTGHSWGAYFSYYVAIYLPDEIAAFGAHSGGMSGSWFGSGTPEVPLASDDSPVLNGIILHAKDDGIVPYKNSQRLYDDLVTNGHNVYQDGIGNDGIIEVDGWGPNNHRYRLENNQTQWDFFLNVTSTPAQPNQPPDFNITLDITLEVNSPAQSIALNGINSGDGVTQPIRVSAASSNPDLIPDPTIVYESGNESGTLYFEPVVDKIGSSTITVMVEDGGLDNNLATASDNAVTSQTFEIDITSLSSPEDVSIAEYGSVSINHKWQTIELQGEYENAVVITSDPTKRGWDPAVVRMQNIDSDSFQLKLQEPNYKDGWHVKETVSYMVIERGTWELSDGTILKAGTLSTNKLSRQGRETVSLEAEFESDNSPAIFTQVQTYKGRDWVTTRTDNITGESFQVMMQEEEKLNGGGHVTETIGWLAVETGAATDGDTIIEGGVTADKFTHQTKSQSFEASFESAPTLLTKLDSFDGADTANSRIKSVNANGFSAMISEEQSRDREWFHTTESLSYLALGGSSGMLNGWAVI
jgi:predicted esterase